MMISIQRKCMSLIPFDELLLETTKSTLEDETKDEQDLAVWLLNNPERFGVPQLNSARIT